LNHAAAGSECAARSDTRVVGHDGFINTSAAQAGKGGYLTAGATRHEPGSVLRPYTRTVVIQASQAISSNEMLFNLLSGKVLRSSSSYSPFSSTNGNSALFRLVFFLRPPAQLRLPSISLVSESRLPRQAGKRLHSTSYTLMHSKKNAPLRANRALRSFHVTHCCY